MIRNLEWGDIEHLVSTMNSLYEEMSTRNPDLGITFSKFRPDRKKQISGFTSLYRCVEEGTAVGIVSSDTGGISGYCEVRPENYDSEISHRGVLGMAVLEEYRGKGIGKALLNRAIDASSGIFEVLTLSVFSHNRPALNLYEKSGFVQYGVLKKAVKRENRYFDEILMMMELK